MDNLPGIVVSIIVVALTVYAVALFIMAGANSYFYAVVVIDLIVSFINSWFISSGRYEKWKTVHGKAVASGNVQAQTVQQQAGLSKADASTKRKRARKAKKA